MHALPVPMLLGEDVHRRARQSRCGTMASAPSNKDSPSTTFSGGLRSNQPMIAARTTMRPTKNVVFGWRVFVSFCCGLAVDIWTPSVEGSGQRDEGLTASLLRVWCAHRCCLQPLDVRRCGLLLLRNQRFLTCSLRAPVVPSTTPIREGQTARRERQPLATAKFPPRR